MDKEVTLDSAELMVLESFLSPSEVSFQGASPEAVPSKELCLKIGSALIEAAERESVVPLVLSEGECWVLRERVNVFASIGARHDVGMSIKTKLYQLLLEYQNDHEIGEVNVANHKEESSEDVAKRLERKV